MGGVGRHAQVINEMFGLISWLLMMIKQKPFHTLYLVKFLCCCLPSDTNIKWLCYLYIELYLNVIFIVGQSAWCITRKMAEEVS